MNKRGSTIVEATMIFPIVIISVISLISIMNLMFESVVLGAKGSIVADYFAGKASETYYVCSNVPDNSEKYEGLASAHKLDEQGYIRKIDFVKD